MEYKRKMQKRGMILIVLSIFLLIYAVFSSAQDTGCCTSPFIHTCEDGITVDVCCAGDAECEVAYFFPLERCR